MLYRRRRRRKTKLSKPIAKTLLIAAIAQPIAKAAIEIIKLVGEILKLFIGN